MMRHDARRPLVRSGVLLAALVVAPLLIWTGMTLIERSATRDATPTSRVVDIDFTVVDISTGRPIAGARIGLDHETGDISHEGPDTWLTTGPDGKVRFGRSFAAVTRREADGVARGLVLFEDGDGPTRSAYFFCVESAGYERKIITFDAIFPKRLLYETPGPSQHTIRLSPAKSAD